MMKSKKRYAVMVTLDEKTDAEVGRAADREGLAKATWMRWQIQKVLKALRDAA